MKKIYRPEVIQWAKLCARPVHEEEQLHAVVDEMFDRIKREGDKAVLTYSRRFDAPKQELLQVDLQAMTQASERLSDELKGAIELARDNIERFHAAQLEPERRVETMPGVVCWRSSRAIESIGIYIPGGTAPLFSTVLMLGVPARLAGCKEIVLCTPPNKEGEIDPAILYTAQLVGVTQMYAVGGIQAIGAMTFGTESIPKVDKIFGPGNQYVMAAKQAALLQGTAIDMPAGPSEVLVVADDSCVPSFVAADLLSQAEHGADSQVMLLSDSVEVVTAVEVELERQLADLPRREMAVGALDNSRAIVLDSIDACIDFSNLYAPEHLIIATEGAEQVAERVLSAGSVFLGNYSCESAGDYASGTNHTLPTHGYARAYSGVSVDSFVKKITFQHISPEGIEHIGGAIELMAQAEQLEAHRRAVSIRLNELKNR